MSELKPVTNFRTRMEAETAGAILEAAGIRVLIQSQEGWTQSPIAPGAAIMVVPEDLDRARDLLAVDDDD